LDDEDEAPEQGEEEEEQASLGKKTWRASLMYGAEGDTKAMIAFKILFPIGIWGFSFVLAYLVWPSETASNWVTLSIAYLVPPLGKESIIPMGISQGFHPMVMALTVTFVDVVVAMILSWNYHYITRIPVAGKGLMYVEKKGTSTMDKYPSIRSGAWFALLGFVSIPGVGAGGFTGSIIGRMVGMRPYSVISAVGVGAIMSGLLYAYLADTIIRIFAENMVLGIYIIMVLVQAVLIIVLVLRLRNMRKWASELEEVTE
jgi:uncharacterized membrane protein